MVDDVVFKKYEHSEPCGSRQENIWNLQFSDPETYLYNQLKHLNSIGRGHQKIICLKLSLIYKLAMWLSSIDVVPL